ncbi:MAG TPA: serine hydrolase [Chitinophagaceae bacterium]|nr:serine hydrolase [Chitinophagaceae bacterium]
MKIPRLVSRYIASSAALFFISLILISCAQQKIAMRSLKENIQQELSKQEGTFAVAFKDLSTGKELLINDTITFHAASTMKTPVLVEVYKQAAEGKFSLSDSLIIKNEFKSIVDGSLFSLDSTDDSETELYKHIGEKRTISFLLYQMIIVSSNFSTNLIIELVGAKNVSATMQQLGAKDIHVLRGVEDGKAFEKGLNNTITAHGLMMLFEKMAKGETVNPAASQAMINILLDQKFNEIIPARLPANVKVAHKTGSINGVQHDTGIVFLPNGKKYVLVLLSKKITNEKASIAAMANVSKLIYEYVNR